MNFVGLRKSVLAIVLSLGGVLPVSGAAHAMQPCPNQSQLFESADQVVRARVKRFSIEDSGLMVKATAGDPDEIEAIKPFYRRVAKIELEIVKTLKGQAVKSPAIMYLTVGHAHILRKLALASIAYGLVKDDTIDLEIGLTTLLEGAEVYSTNSLFCNYSKLSDELSELSPESAE